jgi:hypothetical protein
MPYSYNVYTGNGSTTQFAVGFSYIRREHVFVSVNYVNTAFTWVNSTTVQVSPAPVNAARVEVRRVTPVANPLVDFTDGSTLVAADLDTVTLQQTYINQEQDDQFQDAVFINSQGLLDAGGKRITNVGDPVNAQDVATKNYVGSYVDATTVASAGDAMTGPLAMGNNKITGLALPTADTDAVNRSYVNSIVANGIGDGDKGDIVVSGSGSVLSIDAGVINDADVNASAGIVASKLSFTQSGTGAVQRTVDSKLKDTISVKDFGAVGDGVADDTVAIQAAIDNAAAMFNQTAYPPGGSAYTSPILFFPPGAYRLTDTLNVYPGVTLSGQAGVPYTVEHTRLIMDTQGGTVNLTKNILNLTRVFQGVARSNSVTVTIEDLGFWITNPGSTIPGRGGTGSVYNPTTGGSHIYCAETSIDTRIRRCNFYSSPNAGIYFNGAAVASFNVDECEFDTPQIGIRLNSCVSGTPQINNSRFFGGVHQILCQHTGGTVQISGCDFQLNGRISVSGNRQLTSFMFTGNWHGGSGTQDNALYIQNVAFANISGNYIGTSTESTIFLSDVDGGTITGNAIVNPGYNTSNSDANLAPAGIRLAGCKSMAVSSNSISAGDGGTFNGFGIISTSIGGKISRCVFTGNKIASLFNGAPHRSQSRILNVETTDSLVGNQFDGTTVEYRMLRTSGGVYYAIPLTFQATAGSVYIPLNDTSSCQVHVHAEQISSNAALEFEVTISRTAAAGTYSIKNVNRDGAVGVGNGPHVVTTGNTVSFGISGSSLQVAFAYTSDPMNYSAVVVGARA